jgi:hypothetical protein
LLFHYIHVVVNRWCRTYFLQQGTSSVIYDEVVKLQSLLSSGINIKTNNADEEEEEAHLNELQKLSTSTLTPPSAPILSALHRLMALYIKLWFHLRSLVYETFLSEKDVLEAGTAIQQKLDDIMNNPRVSVSSPSLNFGLNLNEVFLHSHEKLQLHMDCLNAMGEIVNIEDVDDMGGVVSC